MAEAIGTVIGVVGFLGQLFDGCVKAYGYFSTAAHMDADAQRLLCKVRIEEMRLVVWGREWGVSEGRLEAHLLGAESNPQMRQLATQIMTELYNTVTDFQKLREKYGLLNEDEGAAAAGGAGAGETTTTPPQHSGMAGGLDGLTAGVRLGTADHKEAETTTTASPKHKGHSRRNSKNGVEKPTAATGSGFRWKREISLRAKWVIADKEKFQNLLRDLKDFNDGLEQLFPPARLPSLQRAWRHSLLESAQRDLSELSLLEKASSGVYPQLNASAGLKQLRINLDLAPQSAFKAKAGASAFRLQRDSLTLPPDDADTPSNQTPPSSKTTTTSNTGSSSSSSSAPSSAAAANKRTQAFHATAGDVVIEWVAYEPTLLDERFVHYRRLDDLARMLHSASQRHPDLHTLDCVGYADDPSRTRYGVVYAAPAPSHDTLHARIASADLKTPDLNDRVSLARSLAVALWSLHSLDWLHKSICSSNVLFFPSSASCAATHPTATAALVPDVSRPYLAGFDASRPDLDSDMSVAARNPSILDLHRHPRAVSSGLGARGPYCKAYDVYSLGLVLLEIGLWKVLEKYHRPHYSADKWRDRIVLPVLVPELGNKMGRLYRDVVGRCLTASPDMTSAEAGQLMEHVVSTLESINV